MAVLKGRTSKKASVPINRPGSQGEREGSFIRVFRGEERMIQKRFEGVKPVNAG
jgi:hypothetical protein